MFTPQQIEILQNMLAQLALMAAIVANFVTSIPPEQPEEIVFGNAVVYEQTKIDEIAVEQNAYFALNGKYKQIEKGQFGIDPFYRYEVTEYVSPKGPGYQITITRETGTDLRTKIVEEKKINIGPEVSRNQDWITLYPYPGRPFNASTTP